MMVTVCIYGYVILDNHIKTEGTRKNLLEWM